MLSKSKKGIQDFYTTLCSSSKKNSFDHFEKWETELNTAIESDTRINIYTNCFYSIRVNVLNWFQYRVIFRILF